MFSAFNLQENEWIQKNTVKKEYEIYNSHVHLTNNYKFLEYENNHCNALCNNCYIYLSILEHTY